jgi:hypothetical protein
MRLLADEGVEAIVVERLREADDHNVLAISETRPRSVDRMVLGIAAREERVLVTNDKDFAELAFLQRVAGGGIVTASRACSARWSRTPAFRQALEMRLNATVDPWFSFASVDRCEGDQGGGRLGHLFPRARLPMATDSVHAGERGHNRAGVVWSG